MAGRRISAVLFVTCLVSFPLFSQAPAVLETTEVSGETRLALPIAEGSRLEIKGVFGEVDVLPADGEETVIEIARPGGGSEPKLVLLRHDNGYTLCAVHTSPNAKKPNECVPGKKGRMRQGIKRDWPRVHFTVSVPDGVDVMALLFGDRVAARSGINNLELEMDYGDAFVHDGGSKMIRVKTGGNIEAKLSEKSWLPEERNVRFDSMGGNINVVVPKSLPIEYAIRADQPVRTSFKLEEKFAGTHKGTAGTGTETVMKLIIESVLLGKVTVRQE